MLKSIYDLPAEIGREISGHLPSIKDTSNAIVDKYTRSLFQPTAILSKFLEFVAHGMQDHAEKIFTIRKKNPQQLQELLLARGTVTDNSGRTFAHISAYEYAYWAKDTHMCRMLELHMDMNTKVAMLTRCEAIESKGLSYKQHGVDVNNSKHFDFTPLITALKNYVGGCQNWERTQNRDAMKAAWMAVGQAQRDVPVYVANEYCRKDRSFYPTPLFNEDKLPRELTFQKYSPDDTTWMSVIAPEYCCLGVDISLVRGQMVGIYAWPVALVDDSLSSQARIDLAAIIRLDEVKTLDLTQLRKNLEPTKFMFDTFCRIS